MIPQSSRQAGFDAACLVQISGKNILRVVQVTCGATHSLRMDAFSCLIQKLVHNPGVIITGLEVIFLLPKFTDRREIEPPSLSLLGAGQCMYLEVGALGHKWAQGHEDSEVLFYGMDVPVKFFSGR